MRPARSAVAPTWAGKPMPRGTGFPARGFGTGRTLRRPPPPAVLSVPSCQKLFRVFRVFRGPTLRPPSAARSRAQLYATGDPRSPRHGLESPCHVARAFQPVGLGRAVPSALRSLLSKILPCVPFFPRWFVDPPPVRDGSSPVKKTYLIGGTGGLPRSIRSETGLSRY